MMQYAYVVKLTPTQTRYEPRGSGFSDPNGPRWVELDRPDPEDDRENPHVFGDKYVVGFSDHPGQAFGFPALPAALDIAKHRYIVENYVGFRGYRVSIVLVRVRDEQSFLLPELGDVGLEVWPEGDLAKAQEALSLVEVSEPAPPEPALACYSCEEQHPSVIDRTGHGYDFLTFCDECWDREINRMMESFVVTARVAGKRSREKPGRPREQSLREILDVPMGLRASWLEGWKEADGSSNPPYKVEVAAALDQARENGYDFRNAPAEKIAVDLGTYDREFEGKNEELIPAIRAWQLGFAVPQKGEEAR